MNALPRRQFLTRSTAALAGSMAVHRVSAAPLPTQAELAAPPPVIVSTWPFGRPANEAALTVLKRGGSGLDAIEQGINVTESDPSNASVGLGGIPNAAGVVQLDACIMSGPGHQAGSVAALEGFVHPISIARRIMETTRHVMLVGEGAQEFAAQHGFERGPKVSPNQEKAWRKWQTDQAAKAKAIGNHDTLAMLVLLPDGNLFGGCSTSGMGYKLPGRIGDSPIIGSGLYVDNEVGAAGATGLGENVLRYCGSFLVVEFMRQGLSPQEACLETIRRIARIDPKGLEVSVNFIALDKKGRFGAAGTDQGFEYAVTCDAFSKVFASPGLTRQGIGPVGGNLPK